MRRTDIDFQRIQELSGRGLSDYEIAATVGIPRATVQRWRHRDRAPGVRAAGTEWQVADPSTYCYLLGCYLGDGHVTHKPPNSWTLKVACDRRYPGIIAGIVHAMAITFSPATPRRNPTSTAASDVLSVSHVGVGNAFPQHGPGRKHLRPIVLTDWQYALTRKHPGALIRGLIHSDGCRAENRFTTQLPSGRLGEYRYVRYFFSNLSADIRNIFTEHCALLGIRVTQSNHRNLSVSHRHSVTILERIVGPKT
jgi:Homeodomain-like domain